MVWGGIVFDTILGKVKLGKNIIKNMWQSNGPARGQQFLNFYQHALFKG
jgi:hypothetical protein